MGLRVRVLRSQTHAANLMDLTFNPLANPRVEKLAQTHALIEQKPIGFRVPVANPSLDLFIPHMMN